MRIKDGFALRDVCGETVIVGEGLGAVDFGKLLVLNDTAAWLWKEAKSQGDFTPQSLAQRLCEEYEVPTDIANADVAEILSKWQDINVIQ